MGSDRVFPWCLPVWFDPWISLFTADSIHLTEGLGQAPGWVFWIDASLGERTCEEHRGYHGAGTGTLYPRPVYHECDHRCFGLCFIDHFKDRVCAGAGSMGSTHGKHPTLGFWLSILANVAITLATNPEKAPWVILGLIVIQLLENNLLAPRVQGSNMKMNPIFILVISLIGAYFIGIAGFIIAVPIAATIIELLKYFRHIAREKETE